MRRSLEVPDQVLLLLSLVPHLHENGPTPVLELAQRFDVDPGLLRKLLRFLGTAGVPGETQTYQHEDLFDIDWDALEHEDVAHLIRPVAVDDAPRFSPAETAALLAGLDSLMGMLDEEGAELARSTAEKLRRAFEVSTSDAAVTVSSEPADAKLITVLRAVETRRQLSFTYRDLGDVESRRRVDPIRLRRGPETWYLRAYCHDREEERTFRLDRMREEEVLSAEATRHAISTGDSSGGAADASPSTLLTVLVRDWATGRISDFDPVPDTDEVLVDSAPDTVPPGWSRATVSAHYPGSATKLVQRVPGQLVVESPAFDRRSVRGWAEEALAQYDL